MPLGTRTKQNTSQLLPPTGQTNNRLSRDVGMSKRVTPANTTFVDGGTEQIQGANGDFAPFVVGDRIIVTGSNLNNGEHQVTAIDAVNHAFLTVLQGCKAEGPIAGVQVRTP